MFTKILHRPLLLLLLLLLHLLLILLHDAHSQSTVTEENPFIQYDSPDLG